MKLVHRTCSASAQAVDQNVQVLAQLLSLDVFTMTTNHRHQKHRQHFSLSFRSKYGSKTVEQNGSVSTGANGRYGYIKTTTQCIDCMALPLRLTLSQFRGIPLLCLFILWLAVALTRTKHRCLPLLVFRALSHRQNLGTFQQATPWSHLFGRNLASKRLWKVVFLIMRRPRREWKNCSSRMFPASLVLLFTLASLRCLTTCRLMLNVKSLLWTVPRLCDNPAVHRRPNVALVLPLTGLRHRSDFHRVRRSVFHRSILMTRCSKLNETVILPWTCRKSTKRLMRFMHHRLFFARRSDFRRRSRQLLVVFCPAFRLLVPCYELTESKLLSLPRDLSYILTRGLTCWHHLRVFRCPRRLCYDEKTLVLM